MVNCAFTIVAKNYVGLASILEQSIKKYFTDFDFYIVVADDVDEDLKPLLPSNVIVAHENLTIKEELWRDMSFKYDITEFCTSIKPASFKYFFSKGYDKCIYLDPDICFFSSIGIIYDMLDEKSIVLTPHLTRLENVFGGDFTEKGVMQTGVFNLGFCGLRRNNITEELVNWWYSRLTTMCFNNVSKGLFTDQKWMDLIPCYFGENVTISRNLGLNVAPWNFHEREIFVDSGEYKVRYRGDVGSKVYPLVFVHYSGFDYKRLQSGDISRLTMENAKRYSDIDDIMNVYALELQAKSDTFDRFISQKYSYNYYQNGEPIMMFHRKLYVGLTSHGENIDNPFSTEEYSFYQKLKNKKMIIVDGLSKEKVTKKNISGIGAKLTVFNKVSRCVYKILGLNRYLQLLRLMSVFSYKENQIHLLDKKYDTSNIL